MRLTPALAVLALLLTAACATKPEGRLTLTLTNYDAMEGWREDSHAVALSALRRSCEALRRKLPKPVTLKPLSGAEAWQAVCKKAQSARRPRSFFEAEFTPFIAGNAGKPTGLFTGYYEPLLHGSLKRRGAYRFPVYGLPDDMKQGVPYYSRAQIDAGALSKRGLEIAWVDDPAALFFAQIQGSARLRLANGQVRRIGYAGKNGQAYVAIGKLLREQGALQKGDVNMFTIRQWLHAHPAEADALMQRNPSYVFFRFLPGAAAPLGAQGTPLTPVRSLAVDARFIPYGMPVFLHTQLPDGRKFNRLLIAQDTGGAIRGPVRGDIFFGAGERAEALAGRMQGQGGYILLVPKSIAAEL